MILCCFNAIKQQSDDCIVTLLYRFVKWEMYHFILLIISIDN